MAALTRVAGDEEGNGEGARGGGMMVVMGHGLCVSFCLCEETIKNKLGPKKGDDTLELIDCARLAVTNTHSGGAI